jgi:prepilin-type N-terminal cleavage/methylation domain-containing protein/prepilin-type processing-associated H-X9-DG protein
VRRFSRPGFSLLELVVVIGVVAILITLSLAAVIRTRALASKTKCSNQLRQIGLACAGYHHAQGSFPPGTTYQGGGDPLPFMSWCTRLLPHLEQSALWEQSLDAYAANKTFTARGHPLGVALGVFACPADVRTANPGVANGLTVGLTSYLGVEGTDLFRQDGILFLDSRVRDTDVKDGLSNTLLVGERPPSPDLMLGWWYAGVGQMGTGSADLVLGARELNRLYLTADCLPGPYHYGPGQVENICDSLHFWSLHSGGANFLFGDCSVRFLAYSADILFPALATRDGGEPVSLPD